MKISILVKSISKGEAQLAPTVYEYPSGIDNAKEFIEETVRICLRQYKERIAQKGYDSAVSLEDRAASGKVIYEPFSKRKPPGEEAAVKNALEAFEDGTVALFVDGKRMESLTDKTEIREGSEAVFVKLTPLSAYYGLYEWII